LNPENLDRLELELRRLGGVLLVAFADREHATVIEMTVEPGTARDGLLAEASRLAESEIERPVVVEIVESHPVAVAEPTRSRRRVQLLAVAPSRADDGLEVHLAHSGKRVVVGCDADDRVAVAEAVLNGLGELGLPVPFEPASVHLLTVELGNGALVILRDRRLGGTRRGLAGGYRIEEAIARAVLNGLNRYLQGGGADHAEVPVSA
jgi:hypothetical protein